MPLLESLMSLIKSVLLGLVSSSLFFNAVAATIHDMVLNTALLTLRHCYEAEQKRDAELVQCLSEAFANIPNPQYYRMRLTEKIPGTLDLLIFDRAGHRIHCELIAQQKIVVKQCTATQSAPLTNELSIIPPDN